MRLWSFHPKYLQEADLRRVWEDALKAQRNIYKSILRNENHLHPQLLRFLRAPDPVQAISDYLHALADVADWRSLPGFDRSKISNLRAETRLAVTTGQVELEIWLYGAVLVKERGNGPAYYDLWAVPEHEIHPCFILVSGAIEYWEKLPPHDYATCKSCGDPVSSSASGKPREKCERCRPSNKRKVFDQKFV